MTAERTAAAVSAWVPGRSMGLKLLLVCGLALLMSIPALFVFALLSDRTNRAEEVVRDVGGLVGGQQTFLGPVLAVPYAAPPLEKGQPPAAGVFVIFPTQGDAKVTAHSELRRRSLFEVPVYQADIAFDAAFDLTGAAGQAPLGAVLDWNRAEFLIGASDARGAKADVTLQAAGRSLPMSPASVLSESALNAPEQKSRSVQDRGLRFFGASAAGVAAPDAKFNAAAKLKFTGAERLAILAFGKTTTLDAKGDWPHPSFDGGFLPEKRHVAADGFTAHWSVPFIARGVPAQGTSDALTRLGPTALGVSFVEPADPYQSVARSLKYALMFVGLVFLAFFLFETAQGKRVHPAQYVLIGLAQIVFYLLLLSIAEHLGFDGAFIIAAGATVGLISLYAGWVFESRRQGVIALAAFSLLYALIYVLMRLEDLALLVGALASFAAIAAVMYFTRRIDWYGAAQPPARVKESV
ncbi:cell envelope integrity protein CreD [Phenylobacterium sp.]|uniref:cell envelope integrity protein CreD n=1 Tax=Phenylobacterium sp. TaxID=1871053 RepID=UPI002733A2A5|nr:cell envelope integrity protein CreD [Phenylobacterium sp.]MDP3660237.1 cell envelope integrity protein CreD [Phenylobacterium sp.]